MKTAVGSELSLVNGTYHENFGSVVMEMASFSLKIRHVFGDTSLTERSIGAGPPVIIQLSGLYSLRKASSQISTCERAYSLRAVWPVEEVDANLVPRASV